MPDYKEMYFKLFRASETAIGLLIDAQKECEEIYLSSPDPALVDLLSFREGQEAESQKTSSVVSVNGSLSKG